MINKKDLIIVEAGINYYHQADISLAVINIKDTLKSFQNINSEALEDILVNVKEVTKLNSQKQELNKLIDLIKALKEVEINV